MLLLDLYHVIVRTCPMLLLELVPHVIVGILYHVIVRELVSFHVIVRTCTMLLLELVTILLIELVPCYCWNLYHVNVGTCSMLLLEREPCYC